MLGHGRVRCGSALSRYARQLDLIINPRYPTGPGLSNSCPTAWAAPMVFSQGEPATRFMEPGTHATATGRLRTRVVVMNALPSVTGPQRRERMTKRDQMDRERVGRPQ